MIRHPAKDGGGAHRRADRLAPLCVLALGSLLAAAPAAFGSTPPATPASIPAAPAPIVDWTRTALHELSAAEIARERALVPDIRRLAAQVAQDFRGGLAQVRALNHRKGWAEAVVDAAAPASFSRRRGPSFDRRYMQHLVQSHLQALTAVRSAARETDPDVRALAANLESTLEAHLTQARDIGGRLERLGIDTGMAAQLLEARSTEQGVQ